jgi:hypothetical protein
VNNGKVPLKKVTAYYPHQANEPAAPDCCWSKPDGESMRVEIGKIFVRDDTQRRHEVPLADGGKLTAFGDGQ